MNFKTIINRSFFNALLVAITASQLVIPSCTDDYYVPYPIPTPRIPVETDNLEASLVSSPLFSLDAKYWKEADYLTVSLTNLNTQGVYDADGLLNMTGTYNGLESFNDGNYPEVILKAAYDSMYLYFFLEWDDSDLDASRASWIWGGDPDPLKPDSTAGWTSQRNDDQISLVFEIESTSGQAGTFANAGCATVCHNGTMAPETGSVDIWNWSTALSEPFGFAFDMYADQDSGLVFDQGQISFERNVVPDGNNRSGPAFEWDGTTQEITRMDHSDAILDPGYFLTEKTPFTGDPVLGEAIYLDDRKGCYKCHGIMGDGNGEIDAGPAFTNVRMNRFSRENLISSASDAGHTGQTYFNKIREDQRDDLLARIRGFAGVPGYYLSKPDSAHTDLHTTSNLLLARLETDHDKYRVIIKRKLNTGKENDVKFDLSVSNSYVFGLAIMDNDGKNHIGSLYETLIFMEE